MFHVLMMTLLMATADPGGNCPHQIAVQIPPKPTTTLFTPCGSGLNLEFGGVHINSSSGKCPVFVTIEPAHAESQSSPGSETYTELHAVLPVARLDFTCQSHWFLIIPTGSSCVQTGESTAGSVNHYVQHNCPVIPEPSAGTAQ